MFALRRGGLSPQTPVMHAMQDVCLNESTPALVRAFASEPGDPAAMVRRQPRPSLGSATVFLRVRVLAHLLAGHLAPQLQDLPALPATVKDSATLETDFRIRLIAIFPGLARQGVHAE